MTNCELEPSITLPLLIAYTDVLLPSLLADDDANIADQALRQTHSSKTSSELLWVVQTESQKAELRSQIDKQLNHHDKGTTNASSALIVNSDIQTLSQLSSQAVKQRYELACFWLPEISIEQLQLYIPTLMRYRDLYAAHCLMALTDINMRAYGFSTYEIAIEPKNLASGYVTEESVNNPLITLWQFNLYDYKRLPNWLNSQYWANPENWNKHRW